jgi:hypothetical protein
MSEKYVVTLTAEERARLETLIAGRKRAASRPVIATCGPARANAGRAGPTDARGSAVDQRRLSCQTHDPLLARATVCRRSLNWTD